MPEIDKWSEVLSEDQIRQWPHAAEIAERVGGCLMGGTAVAVHLRHRRSVDFDIMTLRPFSGGSVERAVRRFARHVRIRDVSANCFHAAVDGVEWDVFRALRSQEVEPDQMKWVADGPLIDGMPVGSIPDLLATKLDVIRLRAKLRDYLDLAAIDSMTAHRIEDGIRYYCERFGYQHVPRALDESLSLLASPGSVPADRDYEDRRASVLEYLSRRAHEASRHLALMRRRSLRPLAAAPAAVRRCGHQMPRAGRPCVLPAGHAGHHRSKL